MNHKNLIKNSYYINCLKMSFGNSMTLKLVLKSNVSESPVKKLFVFAVNEQLKHVCCFRTSNNVPYVNVHTPPRAVTACKTLGRRFM